MTQTEAQAGRKGRVRVLHVAETLTGGIASYLNETLPSHYREYGVEQVHVLGPAEQLPQLKGLTDATRHGYRRSGRNLGSLLRLALELRRLDRELQPELIHLHSSFAGGVGRLIRPLLRRRTPMVYCPHGWSFSMEGWKRHLYLLMERLLAPLSDAWIAISEHEFDTAVEHGLPKDKGELIVYGISDLPPAAPATPLDPGNINLLFAGRFDRQKGLDLLLTAMEQLGDAKVKLYIAGAAVLAAEGSRVERPNIVWLGWQTPAQLQEQYRACDAVIMPSRWEGFGLVAAEGLRAGKAVLAARRGALPGVVEDGVTGKLFELEDIPALVRLLQGLQRPQLEAWGVQGRLRYLEKFTAARMNAQLSNLYRRLLP